MHMQGYDIFNDKDGIGIPGILANPTSMDTEHDNYTITTKTLVHEQLNDSNC